MELSDLFKRPYMPAFYGQLLSVIIAATFNLNEADAKHQQ
jgi:hypothetical protein